MSNYEDEFQKLTQMYWTAKISGQYDSGVLLAEYRREISKLAEKHRQMKGKPSVNMNILKSRQAEDRFKLKVTYEQDLAALKITQMLEREELTNKESKIFIK